jgi:hypothetical protein
VYRVAIDLRRARASGCAPRRIAVAVSVAVDAQVQTGTAAEIQQRQRASTGLGGHLRQQRPQHGAAADLVGLGAATGHKALDARALATQDVIQGDAQVGIWSTFATDTRKVAGQRTASAVEHALVDRGDAASMSSGQLGGRVLRGVAA